VELSYATADEALVLAGQLDGESAERIAEERLANTRAQLQVGVYEGAFDRMNRLAEASPDQAGKVAAVYHAFFAQITRHDPASRWRLAPRLKQAMAALWQQEGYASVLAAARDLIEAEQYADAQSWINEVLAADPGNGKAVALGNEVQYARSMKQALLQLEQQAYAGAELSARQALAAKPDDADAEQLLGSIAQQRMGDRLEGLLENARAELANGRYEEAERVIRQILAIAPDDPQGNRLKSQVDKALFDESIEETRRLVAGGQLEQAEQAARAAVDRKPNDIVALQLLSDIRQQLFRRWCSRASELSQHTHQNEAEELVKRAIRLSAENPAALDLLREIQRRKSDPDTAELSGYWRTPNGQRVKVEADDRRVRVTAETLPPGLRSWSCDWQRDGHLLRGTMEYRDMTGTERTVEVSAAVASPTVIKVRCKEVRWTDPTRTRGKGYGVVDWQKEPTP
jgi:tetratricopeptide (TPR) repeat protein